jgi:hypothetical protein
MKGPSMVVIWVACDFSKICLASSHYGFDSPRGEHDSCSRMRESQDRPLARHSLSAWPLVYLTVQRASRFFWRSFAGLSFQPFGMPSAIGLAGIKKGRESTAQVSGGNAQKRHRAGALCPGILHRGEGIRVYRRVPTAGPPARLHQLGEADTILWPYLLSASGISSGPLTIT